MENELIVLLFLDCGRTSKEAYGLWEYHVDHISVIMNRSDPNEYSRFQPVLRQGLGDHSLGIIGNFGGVENLETN